MNLFMKLLKVVNGQGWINKSNLFYNSSQGYKCISAHDNLYTINVIVFLHAFY